MTFPAFDFRAGELLPVDKPRGWTSFDVVNRLRYRLRELTGVKRIKVGHSGTLDPMATGLLLVATGKATKRLTALTGLPKGYTGTMRFGASTPSYDAETEVDATYPTEHLTRGAIEREIAAAFTGVIEQRPPAFSAIKIDGQRAYAAARRGEPVELPTRRVAVTGFAVTRCELPEVDFAVDVSKGTYVRSLAHDLGRAVGSGAYLTALRRTSIGDYRLADAHALDALTAHLDALIAARDRSPSG